MELTLSIVNLEKAVIASPGGELDLATAPDLHEQLLRMLSERKVPLVVVALDRLEFCDAAGLRVLVHAHRRARLLDVDLRLAAPTPVVAKLLRITGLDQSFRVWPTVVAAMAEGVPAPSEVETVVGLPLPGPVWNSSVSPEPKVMRVS